MKVEYVAPDFAVVVAGHWQGRWDMNVQTLTVTQQRAEVLIFTDPYTKSPTVAAVHQANTSVKDVKKDLDGKKIGVCGGCSQSKRMTSWGAALPVPPATSQSLTVRI